MSSSSSSPPSMEYRYLGRSGLRVSALSLGAWVTWGNQVSDDAAFDCMKTAYDFGCNFFDNAEVYANGKAEETMGRCIKRLNVNRSELVISTKVFWGGTKINQRGLSRKHIVEGLRASLKRLDLDYVDVVFAHRPDVHTPIEEVVRAFNFVIDQGWAFYWGTSEWPAELLVEAHDTAKRLNLVGPLCEQPQYSMLHRTRVESEYAHSYALFGLGLTIWSPLACGLLTGKYSKEAFPEGSRLGASDSDSTWKWLRDQLMKGDGMNGLEEKNLDVILHKVDGLKPIADRLQCTLAQLALAWCLKNSNVSTVITGATSKQQVAENFKALTVVPKITAEVMAEIEAVIKNKPAAARDFKA